MLIGDDQMVCGQLAYVAVQGGQLLALLRPANNDLAPLYVAVVEGVHRLAVLQHDIVGDIHDVVDGAHAHSPQPLPHPLGGGGDLYVSHHPGGVPRAQVGRRSFHVQQLHQGTLGPALDQGLMEAQGLVKGGGHFSRQADDRQAVGAVGGDLKLHHMVIQANDRLQVVSGLAVLAENKDAVWDAVGELCLLGVEVGQSADGVHLSVIGH